MQSACGYAGRGAILRIVLISLGGRTQPCLAVIDADCWPRSGAPKFIAGSLDSHQREWEAWANARHLVLMLKEDGVPYRVLLDVVTGRFVAQQL